MPKTTTPPRLDRAGISAFGKDVAREIEAFAKAKGLTVKVHGTTYSRDGTFGRVTLEFAQPGESAEVKRWRDYAEALRFSPADLGRQFSHKGTVYEVAGLTTGLKVIATRVRDGQAFTFTTDGVRGLLAISTLPRRAA